MKREFRVDFAVVGAGSAGLSFAAGAAQLGASVVLFEQGDMGGDCLNTGCVPSKALIAASRAAHAVRDAARYGVRTPQPEIDFAAVVVSPSWKVMPIEQGLEVRPFRVHILPCITIAREKVPQ